MLPKHTSSQSLRGMKGAQHAAVWGVVLRRPTRLRLRHSDDASGRSLLQNGGHAYVFSLSIPVVLHRRSAAFPGYQWLSAIIFRTLVRAANRSGPVYVRNTVGTLRPCAFTPLCICLCLLLPHRELSTQQQSCLLIGGTSSPLTAGPLPTQTKNLYQLYLD